ncbi:M14 family zinc carboxypeptidase [Candidatus Neomarinimicrobiota bacterium]
MKTLTVFFLITALQAQIPLKYQDNITPTYIEAIQWYDYLANKYENSALFEYGKTDIGKPLHLFVISKNGIFNPKQIKNLKRTVILINNAIHPGEPCGVDGSLKFADNLLRNNTLPDNVVVCIIPVYNIGGTLKRNSTTRANQNGPEEYGFRGNARNFDLNRDFIKLDSKNARSFVEIFQEWNPDILVDTHTTNGADYQHIMTYLGSHPQNYPPPTSDFIKGILNPSLNKLMLKKGFPMVPYVSSVKDIPNHGIRSRPDPPSYSDGYAALFNTLAYISEAHMLKTYGERVLATTAFLESILNIVATNARSIQEVRNQSDYYIKNQELFDVKWISDTTRFSDITFKGYSANYEQSTVTGHKKLFYDQSKPWEGKIPFYEFSISNYQIKKPDYYIIPQGWQKVIERFALNRVPMIALESDTMLSGEMYIIEDFSAPAQPYNGHYYHDDLSLKIIQKSKQFYKGDIIVPMNSTTNRYVIETLEPYANDSFFRWNFFDSILDWREYFSPYLFEVTAEQLLATDPQLLVEFLNKKKSDSTFSNNAYQQLEYLYKRSPNFEPDYRLYPIMRVNNPNPTSSE